MGTARCRARKRWFLAWRGRSLISFKVRLKRNPLTPRGINDRTDGEFRGEHVCVIRDGIDYPCRQQHRGHRTGNFCTAPFPSSSTSRTPAGRYSAAPAYSKNFESRSWTRARSSMRAACNCRRCKAGKDRQVNAQPDALDAAHPQRQWTHWCLSTPNSRSTAPRLL
jgi:hypothetical protein